MTLRRKLMLAFLTVTILPFGALLLALSGPAVKEAEDLVGTRLEDNVQLSARAIDQFMVNCVRDMKAFTAEPEDFKDDQAATNELLDRLTHFYPYFREFSFADLDGKIVACSDETMIRQSIYDVYGEVRPDYEAAVKGAEGTVYISQLGDFSDNRKRGQSLKEKPAGMRLQLLAPVFDPDGKCKGVLSGYLVMQHLKDLLSEIDRRIPGDKYSILLDKEGHTLLNNDPSGAQLTDSDMRYILEQIRKNPNDSGHVTYKSRNGEDITSGYSILWSYGVNKTGNWILVASSPYDIIMHNVWTTLIRGGVILLLAIIAAILMSYWLARTLAEPVLQLTEGAKQIFRGNYSSRAYIRSKDETGELADAFNQMAQKIQEQVEDLRQANENLEKRVEVRTAELAEMNTNLQGEVQYRIAAQEELLATQSQLTETSRQAGMAEVATSVLHNVGNVLNSVNVTTTLVSDRLQKSKVDNISKLADLLQEHRNDLGNFVTNDQRGKQLPEFLSVLARHLETERVSQLEGLRSLQKNVEHIKDIVAMQQSYAKVYGVTEVLAPSELVEDALHLNAGALVRHEVAVIREYEDTPSISVERHKVLQILVNLIRNAKYACDETGRADKWIRMEIRPDGEYVIIAVVDNGVGIPLENMDRIFAHGFTTRDLGHGFGLHNSALVARELGGSLQASSKGPGHGATFTLRIPFKPSPRTHEPRSIT